MSLKALASVGALWVALERFGQQILQVALFIILARLLSPDDFGLVAMLVIFFAIAQSFVDSGMGQALIREDEITTDDRTTVFYTNLIIAVLFYFILYVFAPSIANFYDQPELINLTRFMGLAVIFFGLTVVQRAELTQLLNFKVQALAQVPAMFLSGMVSVILAFKGYGVWALAFQYVLLAMLSSVFLWVFRPVKLNTKWSKESFIRLFSFGYKLLLSGLLNTVYMHIYKLVIGKFFAASILGYFTQAKKMEELVGKNLSTIIEKVTYPLLSKSKNEPERLKRGYREIVLVSSFVIFPSMIGLIILAEPIIHFVLGPQWLPAVPMLRIVCLSGLLYHLHAINLNILKVQGRSDLFLKLEILKKVIVTIAIVIGLQFGLYGLLIGQVISSYISLIINSYYTNQLIGYSIFNQLRDVGRVLLLTIPMSLTLFFVKSLLPINSILMLIFYIISGILIYLSSNILFKSSTSVLFFGLTKKFLPEKLKVYL